MKVLVLLCLLVCSLHAFVLVTAAPDGFNAYKGRWEQKRSAKRVCFL